MRQTRTYLGAIGLAVVMASAAAPAAAEEVRTVTVTATEFKFQPNEIEVEAGETLRIRLRNAGVLSHNLYIGGDGAHTETLQKGATGSVTFTPDESGTLRLFCKVPGHRQAGMTGKLHVSQ